MHAVSHASPLLACPARRMPGAVDSWIVHAYLALVWFSSGCPELWRAHHDHHERLLHCCCGCHFDLGRACFELETLSMWLCVSASVCPLKLKRRRCPSAVRKRHCSKCQVCSPGSLRPRARSYAGQLKQLRGCIHGLTSPWRASPESCRRVLHQDLRHLVV